MLECSQRLRDVGVDTVIMLSTSRLRNEVLTDVIGSDIKVEHRAQNDREIGWDEYLGMCKLFEIVPSKVGYQQFTAISKVEARMESEEMSTRQGAVVVNADTVIMTSNLRPIEKPASAYEALQQIVELGSRNPYLISTMVSVFGMGVQSACMTFAMDSLPVCRIPSRPAKYISKTWNMYRSGEYPRVPGAISHHLPEIAEIVYYYRHDEPEISLRIDPDEFFARGKASPSTPRSLWNLVDKFDDAGGSIVRQVGLTAQTFHRVSYEPERDLEITRSILGAPPHAFVAALNAWVRMVESGGDIAIPFPRRKLLNTRIEIRRIMNTV